MSATSYFQLFFEGRSDPFCIPVPDEIADRAINLSPSIDPFDSLHEFYTLYGQTVLVNESRSQFFRVLLDHEGPVISLDDIKPSPWLASTDPEEEIGIDPAFEVLIWFRGRDLHLDTGWVSIPAWEAIKCGRDNQEEGIVIADGDGEELFIRPAQIDLVMATEIDRYTEDQVDVIRNETLRWCPGGGRNVDQLR